MVPAELRAERVVPLQTQPRPKAMRSWHKGTEAASPRTGDEDERAFQEHIAAFQGALAAAVETLSKPRAPDGAKMAASGD